MRRLCRLLGVFFLALAFLLLGTGVVAADNCSSATDTQNCMAAINFAAAAAAAAAAGGAIAASSIVTRNLTPESASEQEKIEAKRKNCEDTAEGLRDLAEKITKGIEAEILFREYLGKRRDAYERMASLLTPMSWGQRVRSVAWKISAGAALTAASMAFAAASVAAAKAFAALRAASAATELAVAGTAAAEAAMGTTAAVGAAEATVVSQVGLMGRFQLWLLDLGTKAGLSATPSWGTTRLGIGLAGVSGAPATGFSFFVAGTNVASPSLSEVRDLQKLIDSNEAFSRETDALAEQSRRRVDALERMVRSYRVYYERWMQDCADSVSLRPPDPNKWGAFFYGTWGTPSSPPQAPTLR